MGTGCNLRDNSQQKPHVCTNANPDVLSSRNLAVSVSSSQFATNQGPYDGTVIFGPFWSISWSGNKATCQVALLPGREAHVCGYVFAHTDSPGYSRYSSFLSATGSKGKTESVWHLHLTLLLSLHRYCLGRKRPCCGAAHPKSQVQSRPEDLHRNHASFLHQLPG